MNQSLHTKLVEDLVIAMQENEESELEEWYYQLWEDDRL